MRILKLASFALFFTANLFSVTLFALDFQVAGKVPQVTNTCAAQNNQVSATLKLVVADPFCCNVSPLIRANCLSTNESLIHKMNQMLLAFRNDVELAGICNFPSLGDPGSCPSHPAPQTPAEQLEQLVDDVECETSGFNEREKAIESYSNTLKQFAQSHCN